MFFSDNNTIKTKGSTMKKTLTLVALLSSFALSSFADEATTLPVMTPEQAKTQWSSMTPEQQQAAMAYAKTQGQGKQAAWQSLTPEEQQAKKDAVKTTAQPYAAQAQTQMQTQMQNRTQTMQPQMQNRTQTMQQTMGGQMNRAR